MNLVHRGNGYILIQKVDRSDPDDLEFYGRRAWFVRWEGGSCTGPFRNADVAQEYANRNGGRWMLADKV